MAKTEPRYKDTLNLPVTPFPMKAGAAQREPEIQAHWDTLGVYAQSLQGKPQRFVLHDGPPYLSSDKIHIGTALNKILKDIITRYKSQRGFAAPYVPGYDGHGLPIENAVVKSIPGGRANVSTVELRKRCRDFAHHNLKGQEAQFKRLGVWGDWEKPYLTIDADFEATQIRLFGEMAQKGFVYKGLKPVYWCPRCETALADAEVEYADHESHSIYVAFKLTGTVPEALAGASLVIWTTTPWTLPANLALSVHPDFEYVLIDTPQWGRLIVAKGLLEAFAKGVKLTSSEAPELPEVLATLKGAELEGLMGQHPFISERHSRVLTGTHVTLEAGTGVVHTAPGHGLEDYEVVMRHNSAHPGQALPILSPVDSKGVFTEEGGLFAGQFYEKANPQVIEALGDTLLAAKKFSHSYPHCWRCHDPVIYRATEQWFISVDAFRQQALEAIQTVTWVPARGETRITNMVANRSDWCISRQRVWGVPIPAFYCTDCKTTLMTPETTAVVEALFREHTSDIWWELSADAILGERFACPNCGGRHFEKEMDIMDVWFDSGVTHTAVVLARQSELGTLPVDLYLEGSDQHRGWFQSSLLTSVMLHGMAPYKSVLTHGFVLDPDGRKMSKSLGNVVDPAKVIEQFGADVLRLWVASVDYTNDVRIGPEMIGQLAEVYKKVRNTVRYLLGNLSDFDPATDWCTEFSLLDRHTLHRLQVVTQQLTDAFDRYEFHRFYQILQNYCVVDLSSFYFDIAKDSLYCDAKNSATRRAIQTVLYELLSTLVRVLVPVMPHLAEDIWRNIPHPPSFEGQVPASAVLAPWPTPNPQYLNPAVEAQMAQISATKALVNKVLEAPRAAGHIGSSLEVVVSVAAKTEDGAQLLKDNAGLLPSLLIVSEVQFEGALPGEVLATGENDWLCVTAAKAPGEKCARCWKLDQAVGQHAEHTTLCARCAQAVS
jgi:isoleucyl-tRNA synthetase